jgi:hypothetical protein
MGDKHLLANSEWPCIPHTAASGKRVMYLALGQTTLTDALNIGLLVYKQADGSLAHSGTAQLSFRLAAAVG